MINEYIPSPEYSFQAMDTTIKIHRVTLSVTFEAASLLLEKLWMFELGTSISQLALWLYVQYVRMYMLDIKSNSCLLNALFQWDKERRNINQQVKTLKTNDCDGELGICSFRLIHCSWWQTGNPCSVLESNDMQQWYIKRI